MKRGEGVVGVAAHNFELSTRCLAFVFVDVMRAKLSGIVADQCIAEKNVLGRMALHSSEIHFLDAAFDELLLQERGEVPGARADDEAGCVGIESVCKLGPLRRIHLTEDVLQRVAIEASARMYGQWRGFVQHEQRLVFVQNVDVGAHIRLGGAGNNLDASLTGTQEVFGADGRAHIIQEAPRLAAAHPFVTLNVREDRAEKLDQRVAIKLGGYVERASILIRHTAG